MKRYVVVTSVAVGLLSGNARVGKGSSGKFLPKKIPTVVPKNPCENDELVMEWADWADCPL